MKTRLRIIALVLALPLLASAVASQARARLDARWGGGVHRPLATFCSDPLRAARLALCRPYNALATLSVVSVVAAAVGLAWLASVAGFAALARRRRTWRLAALRFAAGGSAVLLAVVLATQGWLLVQALPAAGFLVRRAGFLRSLTGPAGLVAIALVGLSCAHSARVVRRLWKPPALLARRVGEAEAPALHGTVARLAAAVGSSPVREIVAGLAPVMFVGPEGLVSLDGRGPRPSLHFSLTLGRILSIPECEALLAAQLSRLQGRAGPRSARFSAAWLRLREEASGLRWRPVLARLAIAPAVAWIDLLVEEFQPAAAASLREDEAGGDAAAVAASGADAYASALVKVHAFAAAWDSALAAMAEAAAHEEQYVNAGALFAEVTEANARPERVALAVAHLQLQPSSTGEPPSRLARAGGADAARALAAALDVRPAVPASSLLGDAAPRLEEDLTTARHLQLRRPAP